MKIYVTQGHAEGIGLEVFFKASLFLSSNELQYLQLLAYQEGVKETLISLQLPFELHNDHIDLAGVHIPTIWLTDVQHSQSFTALELGMKLAETGGILFTLPTSKDQFPGFAGHTEYFRHFYRRSDLGMFFSSPDLQVLLVTDHVSIAALPKILSEERITRVLKTAATTLARWEWPTNRFFVSGLNPHAGEQGLIGTEDGRVSNAIKRIQDELDLDIMGPFPGDTMSLEKKDPRDVLVYLYHDQGLALFKGLHGFIGSNITLGLPYPRFSPDHGTSFGLFGKNQADYRGCRFVLAQALDMLKRMYGQDSSHQSKSSQS